MKAKSAQNLLKFIVASSVGKGIDYNILILIISRLAKNRNTVRIGMDDLGIAKSTYYLAIGRLIKIGILKKTRIVNLYEVNSEFLKNGV